MVVSMYKFSNQKQKEEERERNGAGKKFPWNLQLFVGEEDGDEGEVKENPSEGEAGEGEEEEKKYSESELEDAIKKRLAKEKRKWQHGQQKTPNKADSEEKSGTDEGESEETKARRKAEAKVACYEAGVAKEAVEDVAALTRAYMDSRRNHHPKKGADRSPTEEKAGRQL